MINSTKLIKVIIAVSLLIFNFISHASNDHERAELSRLVNELQLLKAIIQIAENSATQNSRITFDYDNLKKDLASIESGIDDYINTVRRDPRKLPAITGEYKE